VLARTPTKPPERVMDGYAVKIDDVFTATQLERFMLELSLRRAEMTPAVPVAVPDSGIPTVRHASFTIDVAPDAITINLRSAGFGWLAYRVNLAGAIGLRDTLNAYFPLSVYPNQPST